MDSALEALTKQSFFATCPEAVGVVTDDCKLLACNARFERTIGPSKVLVGSDLFVNCIWKEEHERFKLAIKRAREVHNTPAPDKPPTEGNASDLVEWALTPTVRGVSTIAMGNTGDFPIWRKMDWVLSVFDDTRMIMTGRLTDTRPAASEPQAPAGAGALEPPSERELLDFLNKAPIAMHWLSGTGHVLWANETEMNVLGYTAEEYIGQPIMNFCPDETELVLEIFKSLGSGCAIKDVPVRFRTKDGRIKHLLIDSNVNWNADGSFKHTRCFIRDDTSRKVREERLRVTREKELELTKAKDVFFRKIFHEIRTPSHVLANSMAALQTWMETSSHSSPEGARLMETATRDWRKLLTLVEDAADASLFHLGKVPVLRPCTFSLKQAVLDLCNQVSWYKSACFTGTNVQILAPQFGDLLVSADKLRARVACSLARHQHASFTGTKVQILTQLEEVAAGERGQAACGRGVLALLRYSLH
jgi:PAS domain S-box-containing protein